jgi:hypothetical protein
MSVVGKGKEGRKVRTALFLGEPLASCRAVAQHEPRTNANSHRDDTLRKN